MPVGVKCTHSYVKRNFSIIKLFSEIRWKLKQFLYSMYNFKVMKVLFCHAALRSYYSLEI